MNYFVNENVFTLNSGTEFSAVKRLKMFRAHQVEAKILTRNYNSQLDGDLSRVGLTHDDVINMYDYFQEITDVPRKDVDLRYTDVIDKLKYHIEGIDPNESLIKHAGRTIGRITVAPATVGLVGAIEYFNDMNGLIAKDIWDRRGFKSSTQYFHPDGTAGPQVFFDVTGKPKIEITHMNVNGVLSPTMYKLLDYKGKMYRFNTEHELFIFFMNELAAQAPSVFINDRPSLLTAVAEVKGAVGKWQFLHTVHAKNNLQAGASRQVADYLEELFTKYNDQFDGLIVPTEQQKAEITKYFSFKKVLALPDTFAEDVAKVEISARDRNKMAALGRIAGEKKPIDIIKIFAMAHEKMPELTLDFYGYPSPLELQKELEQLVESKGLKGAVNFRGYLSEEQLSEALDKTALVLNTSDGEGFGMNVLEAMSHGVPIVAYKVKYGIPELVDEGKNGRLIPYGAMQPAANAVVDLLQSQEKWEAFSQAAYEKAKGFDMEAAWTRWLNHKVIADNLFVSAQ